MAGITLSSIQRPIVCKFRGWLGNLARLVYCGLEDWESGSNNIKTAL